MAAKTKTGQRRRERESESRRQAMIGAAVELFASHGYFGTKIEDIAERADFSRSAVYLHFPGGKEELYTVALIVALQHRTRAIESALREMESESPSLVTVWRALEAFYGEHPNYVRLLGSLSFDDIRRVIPDAALDAIKIEGTKTFRLIDDLLRNGTPGHEGLSDLPRLHSAWIVWSCFLGAVQFAESLRHIGHDEDPSRLLASTLRILETNLAHSGPS